MANISTGIYALCTHIWDEKTKKYIDRDTTEILKCCINRCDTPVTFCNKTCKDLYGKDSKQPDSYSHFRCNETCNDQKIVCQEGCQVNSNWGESNPFIACAKDKNCWPGISPDPDCIQKHKEELINCCNAKCTDETCTNLCSYTYDLTSDHKKLGESRNNYAPAKISYEDQTWEYVISGISVGIIIFVIFLFTNRKR